MNGATQKAEGRGTLVLVVGPSGVGKDSLIAYCRDRLPAGAPVSFPKRLVTRPADDGAEQHVPLSEADFREQREAGAFALAWHAHGLGYGIPVEVAEDLAAGRHVVVNVSRAVIPDARSRFAPVKVVSVTADPGLLAGRLHRRGRELGERIGTRLQRAGSYAVSGDDVLQIDNSGRLEKAGETLLDWLRSL